MDLIFLIGVVLILGFVLVTTIKGRRAAQNPRRGRAADEVVAPRDTRNGGG